jgi:hypothetical protein
MCRRIRRSSMTLGLIGDQVAKLMVPDVDADHEYIIRSYDKTSRSFDRRWGLLREQLVRFHQLAVRHGDPKPLFLILPLMVDYSRYSLETAHEELTRVASETGYDVVDFLPVFRTRMQGDGIGYRAAPNDNHFDARTHHMVAELLWDRLKATAPASRPASMILNMGSRADTMTQGDPRTLERKE